METNELGFIGGGRITKIFLQAFKNKAVKFNSIVVFEPDQKILAALKNQFPGMESADSPEVPARLKMVILAVHPPVMMETIERIKNAVNEHTIILSLAPKITMEKISTVLPTRKIIRMIPNATSYINEGYNPVSFHDSFLPDEKERFLHLFEVLGETFEVKETYLESYAIVSAMLPTYFWFQWEKMQDIAQKTGFSQAEATRIIKETLTRSVKLFYDSGLSSNEVIDLIPVKPMGDKEEDINSIYESKLLGLFEKIKP